ncbi:hypothetical protein OG401_23990 [Kitasatospora purpeofusca]|uniref:hypothetical protein n=1 Tax=Kitasatospora purpeofusca TaxID=67352 RepID=UPI00225186F6|nr:hypothetical protein [Kitasatospora purpeofusca]MCX4687326.1 hypothetical protein [Kitasatospora purpeofusca]
MTQPEALEGVVRTCRMCPMLDRLEDTFLEAPVGERDTAALADVEEKRKIHEPHCPDRDEGCEDCVQLAALEAHALSDPEGRNESALVDLRILRERHAPVCPAAERRP